ncbi:MAG TPA: sugar ABC transporter ATP-binding protein [Kineosporiaceae bacterium]
MTGIDQRFPGVHALDQAHFELRSGEVHALVGENGAGKSTIMKVLAGVYPADAGRIELEGHEVTFGTPREALAAGIGMVHQELNLVPRLTVAQNIWIGREPRRLGAFVDDAELGRRTAALLERLNIALDPTARADGLTVAKQQMVEIARTISYRPRVLIMDEPTAALTDTEIAELFRIVRQLRAEGVGVVHISHRLEELAEIADRVTVMRDGHTVATHAAGDVSTDDVIRLLVGRTLLGSGPELPERPSTDVVLAVRGLSRGRAVRDVSFDLHRGEILGVAGLMGAGRTELARLLFGADRRDAGTILVHGREAGIASPRQAVRAGIAYLSEDRKRFGLALGMDVESNLVHASLGRFSRRLGWIDRAATREVARNHVKNLRIKTPGLGRAVRSLSGGNQQKVVVGKWLTADCEVLIFDEPTRGIDVGAKSEIYALLNDLARRGRAIIMISSELPEILRLSHRVLVLCEGRVAGELTAAEATQEKIMSLATQRTAVVHARAGTEEAAATGGDAT